MTETVAVYTDYKSPYAYLAMAATYALEQRYDVRIDWRPYVVDIPAYLGSAERDAAGEIVAQERNAHQWRRVKYSYMDCRRIANRVGLTIRGPRKIFDSRLVAIGMLYAKERRFLRRYNDLVFERFWKRELDIEDLDAVTAVLDACGADTAAFASFVEGEGRRERERLQHEAEEAGIFGVPTFVVRGEIYWGRENLPLIEEMLPAR